MQTEDFTNSLLYPAVGFHFSVTFGLLPQLPSDIRFMGVSGLSVTMNTETYTEGGENRFIHKLPTRTEYAQLELKRGIFVGSVLIRWCIEAIEQFNFKPVDVLITLLNNLHVPVAAWYVVHAYPVKWSVSNFNAMANEVAVETITLNYQYFKTLQI